MRTRANHGLALCHGPRRLQTFARSPGAHSGFPAQTEQTEQSGCGQSQKRPSRRLTHAHARQLPVPGTAAARGARIIRRRNNASHSWIWASCSGYRRRWPRPTRRTRHLSCQRAVVIELECAGERERVFRKNRLPGWTDTPRGEGGSTPSARLKINLAEITGLLVIRPSTPQLTAGALGTQARVVDVEIDRAREISCVGDHQLAPSRGHDGTGTGGVPFRGDSGAGTRDTKQSDHLSDQH